MYWFDKRSVIAVNLVQNVSYTKTKYYTVLEISDTSGLEYITSNWVEFPNKKEINHSRLRKISQILFITIFVESLVCTTVLLDGELCSLQNILIWI